VDGASLWFLSPEDVRRLVYARPKDLVDLERLFAARPDLDAAYIESWLARIVPPGDRRLATLADLARRFSPSGWGVSLNGWCAVVRHAARCAVVRHAARCAVVRHAARCAVVRHAARCAAPRARTMTFMPARPATPLA
jgi:hypothetical protein